MAEPSKLERDRITPEEKLLKIIENSGAQKAKIQLGLKAKPLDIKTITAKLKSFKFNKKEIKNLIKQINLRLVNKIVTALCGLLTIFWLFDFIRVGSSLKNRFERVMQTPTASAAQEIAVLIPAVNLGEVLIQAKKRNMFTLLPAPTKAEGSAAQETVQKVTNLKLVGILWSSNPQAMIENSTDQRTSLLSAGEKLGDITIKKIFRDKVILEINGEEQELR